MKPKRTHGPCLDCLCSPSPASPHASLLQNGYTELWSTKAAAGEKEVIVLEYRTLLDEFKPGVDNNPAPAVGVPPPFVLIEDDGVAPPKIATVVRCESGPLPPAWPSLP